MDQTDNNGFISLSKEHQQLIVTETMEHEKISWIAAMETIYPACKEVKYISYMVHFYKQEVKNAGQKPAKARKHPKYVTPTPKYNQLASETSSNQHYSGWTLDYEAMPEKRGQMSILPSTKRNPARKAQLK
mmetsp:Transcript_67221/g.75299  ORF Transcript_67221/g.75299 Transcript_67221/m.75299 type:complete len:131 (+) Transcript_67221:146-538(+)